MIDTLETYQWRREELHARWGLNSPENGFARAAAAFLRSRPPEVDKRASLLGGASHPVVGLDGDAEETVKPPRPRSLRERSSRATVAPSKPPYPPDFRSPPARRHPRR